MTRIVNNEQFEKALLDALVKSKLVKHVVMSDVLSDLDQQILINLLSKPTKISYDENGLYFVDDNGDTIECPSYGDNLQADGQWLSDKIDPITFDVEQNGNIRKADEAQAAYSCLVVCSVLNDTELTNEFKSVISNYDFTTMSPKDGYLSFRETLNQWQELQSILINVAVSAANYKIADLKKDSERFLKDSMSEETSRGLRNLTDAIKSVNQKYSKGPLSPLNVQTLKKIDILQIIEDRQKEIDKLVEESGVEIEYKISRLNSEYVSPLVKRKLIDLSRKTISNMFKEQEELNLVIGDPRALEERWRKRYMRLCCISMRKENLERLRNDRENYKFPVKM